MPYDLPNINDAAYPFQSRVYSTDWHILGACAGGRSGIIGTGTEGEVTEIAIPGMSVEVAAGRANFNGTPADFLADTVTIAAADGTNPRWDLITVDSAGNLQYHQGTVAVNPVPPDPAAIPLGVEVALAYVYVPANDTAILDEQIIDKRVGVLEPLGASQWTTLTAPSDVDRASTTVGSIDPVLQFAMAANTKYRVRWAVLFRGNPTGAVGGTGGVKVGLNGPASPTLLRVYAGLIGSGVVDSNLSVSGTYRTFTVYNVDALSSGSLYCQSGIIHNGANSGTFGIYWSQTSSNVNLTRRYAGSWLEYEVV
jgi:hypothetical protein